MKFQFVEDHRDEFPVIRMCKVLDVSPSGYYAWRGRPPSKREMANRALTQKIKEVFKESDETYSSPRIYQVMRKLGLLCSQNRVARLIRAEGLRAKQSRRRKTTTKRNKAHRAAPNRLNRDFSAERPNQKWLADISYLPTQEGWLYLVAILDLFSRRIVGWAMLYTYQCECGSPRVRPCLPVSSWFLYRALARRPSIQQGCVSVVGFRLLSLHGCSVTRHCLPPSILARWATEITQVANVLLSAMWYTGCESNGEERR